MTSTTARTVTLAVSNGPEAQNFLAALGVDDRISARTSTEPTSGFRGFTLSLITSQPSNVDLLVGSALEAGATTLKPVKKTFWGYGGSVQAPDGTIWKVASSAKKSTKPASADFDKIALLLGVQNMSASKAFYIEHGFPVGKSFGNKYVEFADHGCGVTLALYGRRALAKDAGVPPEGSGSHRIFISAENGPFTDPDGFVWE
jgi:predicted lactoylglutathione lyase